MRLNPFWARVSLFACQPSRFNVSETVKLSHGTCVALGDRAAILQGAPGSGKSDLALRFIFGTPEDLAPALVSDDQIRLTVAAGRLIASPPETIAGRIEVRGIGILAVPFRPQAEVKLLVELVAPECVPRLPPSQPPCSTLCGIEIPTLRVAPFEASAHLKLRLALQNAGS